MARLKEENAAKEVQKAPEAAEDAGEETGKAAAQETKAEKPESAKAKTARAKTAKAKAAKAKAEKGGPEEAAEPGRPIRPARAARAEGATWTPRLLPRAVRRQPLLVVAAVAASVAAVLAVTGGTSWYAAAHDDSAAYGKSRDQVLAAAEQGVQNLNTLDHRNLSAGLRTWEESTTGDLRKQLTDGRDEFKKQVKAARTVTTAKILSGAVAELDDRAGKAGVLVAVRTTVTAPKQKPTTKDNRMRGELTRTADGWKLSALAQVPVGDTAAADDGTSVTGD